MAIPITPVTGYRQLSQAEIDLMNDAKMLAVHCGEFVEKLKAMPDTDKRWLAIGATELQQGFMAVIRSVARPETF
jgi:hypothetical protein